MSIKIRIIYFWKHNFVHSIILCKDAPPNDKLITLDQKLPKYHKLKPNGHHTPNLNIGPSPSSATSNRRDLGQVVSSWCRRCLGSSWSLQCDLEAVPLLLGHGGGQQVWGAMVVRAGNLYVKVVGTKERGNNFQKKNWQWCKIYGHNLAKFVVRPCSLKNRVMVIV